LGFLSHFLCPARRKVETSRCRGYASLRRANRPGRGDGEVDLFLLDRGPAGAGGKNFLGVIPKRYDKSFQIATGSLSFDQ